MDVPVSPSSFTSLCRLCLEPDQAVISIFKENDNGARELYDKISVCLPVKLDEEDSLPKKICNTCHNSVDFIYNFWQLSSNSEKQLLTMIGNFKSEFHLQESGVETDNSMIIYDTLEVKDVIHEDKELEDDENNADVEIKEVYFGEYLNQCDTIEDENTVLINEDNPIEETVVENNVLNVQPINPIQTLQSNNPEDIQISQIVESSNVSLRKNLSNREESMERITESNADVKLNCPICSKHNSNETLLRKHIKDTHKRYSCTYCDKLFKQRSSLAYHKFTHFPERRHRCEQCNVSFKRNSDLRGHMNRVHAEVRESDFKKCTVCDYKTKIRRRYNIHVLSHVGSFLYYCDQCGKGFNDNLGLKTHLNNHLGIKPYQCDVCGKKFTREPYMKQHRRKVHEQPLSFECDTCGKKFSFKCSLTTHLKIHANDGSTEEYQCPMCKRMIKSKASLRNHIKLHTGEKPFSCSECPKSFATKLQLQRHSYQHQDYKAYQCDVCKKSFAYKRLLTLHKEIHKENRVRHSCHHCDNQYISKNKLALHIKKHHMHSIKENSKIKKEMSNN